MRVSELIPERLGGTLIADTGFGHEKVPARHAAASVSITAAVSEIEYSRCRAGARRADARSWAKATALEVCWTVDFE